MKLLTGVQKITIASLAVILLGGTYLFYQSYAGTTINLTLTENPDLNRGLVLHYTFDGPTMDFSSSTAEVRDRSSNALNANWLNHASGTVPGPLGQAINLDPPESGSYALVTASSSQLYNLGPFTYAMWIKPASGGYMSLVGKTSSNAFRIALSSNSQIDVFRGFTGTNLGVEAYLNSTVIDEWVHIVVTWDGSTASTSVKVFENGVDVGNYYVDGGDASGTLSPDDGPLVIGNQGDYFATYVGGMDDFRVYNRALNDDEIKRLYQLGATTKVAQTIDTNPNLERGLVGHWTFDGSDVDWSSSTAEVRDRSGQGNHGDATDGASSISAVGGVLGQALALRTNENIRIPSRTSIDNLNPATYSLWFKTASSTDANAAFAFDRDVEGDLTWEIVTYSDGRIWFRRKYSISPITLISPFYSYNANEWVHVAVTISGASSSNAYMYINGVVVDNGGSDAQGTLNNDTNTYTRIWGPSAAGATVYVDDARLYNRALSADEIKRLYQIGATTKVAQTIDTNPNLERGLVGHWTFDGPDVDWSSTTAEIRDRSDQGNHANAVGSFSTKNVIPGPIGQAIWFDPSMTFVEGIDIPADASLDNLNPATFSLWFKIDEDYCGGFIERDPGNGSYWSLSNGYGCTIQRLNFHRLYDGASDLSFTTPEGTYTPDEWTHMVVTINGSSSSNMHLYVNGREQCLGIFCDGAGDGLGVMEDDSGTITTIGPDGGPIAMDDVRIYNRALSAEEVKRLYQLGQ